MFTLMSEIRPETSNGIYDFSVFVNCRLVLTRFPSRRTSLVSNAFPGDKQAPRHPVTLALSTDYVF